MKSCVTDPKKKKKQLLLSNLFSEALQFTNDEEVASNYKQQERRHLKQKDLNGSLHNFWPMMSTSPACRATRL